MRNTHRYCATRKRRKRRYLFSVAAGVPPAVEPGILPGGLSRGLHRHFRVQSCDSERQDAALYGSQDGCHYSRKPMLNTYKRRFRLAQPCRVAEFPERQESADGEAA
jgi:hypothetical protein